MRRRSDADIAFIEIVDRLLDRVYSYLRNLTRDEDAARDLAHQTFLRIRHRLEADPVLGDAYVFAAARNAALSRWRQHQHRDRLRAALEVETISSSDGAGADVAVERSELKEALESALQRLPEQQRSVFLLSEVEGLKQREISVILGLAPGTVASRKFAAVRALRRELERRGHALPRVS
jgi:RNA polymerase sigma factor (sigma-70 family)